ncbi:hypothetical protein ACLB2K_056807 [Fragaria x ananassa]
MKARWELLCLLVAPVELWTTNGSLAKGKPPQPHLSLVPRRRLTGHFHFVQDVVLSFDGQFALSGSWDGELCLWDLAQGISARLFVSHTKDVLSVAYSIDNRQIVSAFRDRGTPSRATMAM